MEILKQIAEDFLEHDITCYYVGGTVRDEIMGISNDDIDICLVGVKDKSVVETVVKRFGRITHEVGKNFPNWVAIIENKKIDFALARMEKLNGDTRKDFECQTEEVTIEQDLYRRDLTINAIAKNVITGEIIDPYNGVDHIKNKTADNVSGAFAEDTLRVLRAARFIARFDLTPSPKLHRICQSLKPTDISNERVGMELFKLFSLPPGTKVSKFFYFLKNVNWLQYHFKELYDTIGCPQSPRNHPEGDVFIHTMYCVDAAKDGFMRAVMLCHDLGKAICTTIDGLDWRVHQMVGVYLNRNIVQEFKIQSIGHEEAGVEIAKNMLRNIRFGSNKIISKIACLVRLHMIRAVYSKQNEQKIVRRNLRILMAFELPYSLLVETVRCDLAGRPPLEPIDPDIGQDLANSLLQTNSMKPIVTGKLLKSVGLKPGKITGEVIKKGLELQDRGTLNRNNWRKVLSSLFKVLKDENKRV